MMCKILINELKMYKQEQSETGSLLHNLREECYSSVHRNVTEIEISEPIVHCNIPLQKECLNF